MFQVALKEELDSLNPKLQTLSLTETIEQIHEKITRIELKIVSKYYSYVRINKSSLCGKK